MRNYALQKGPCNFLNLRTSPCEIPFLLLLCFSSLFPLPSVSFHPAALLLGSSPCLPSSARLQDRRRKRERSGTARALGSGGAGAARAGAAPGGVERGVLWQNRVNYSCSSALMIAMQMVLTQRTSNGTIHWSIGSPPDTTMVQQDRSRFTSQEGEFTITEQLINF
jgi:hypothetical protein